MKISFVIPIYNAEKIIQETLDILNPSLQSMNLDYEILFRDDGSSDASCRLLSEISRRHSRVRCFYNDENRGLGFTLRHLFEDAEGEIIIYLDCDLPFGVEILPSMIQEILENDIVVASRYAGESSKIPLMRKITSRAYYCLCHFLFSVNARDIGSGTVAFRKESVRSLKLTSDRFDIHAEIFAKAYRMKLSVKELPARYRHGQRGSFSVFLHGPDVVMDTFKLWKRL
ncbi:MAG TPA: glycosyltransferase family 2 protein [Candidatus Omnitrophota bacterium]|nr:glycosyltransferase family 2 protein [Candidatus Omnitrophota bacterium]HPD84438.1 glycosyltransferase family 2 protein [Candidatus Omnitrophota bacterium]HRZ03296.1 glycosyltransferase family 2 protein [Candidatus Omnitrophota bacterium]